MRKLADAYFQGKLELEQSILVRNWLKTPEGQHYLSECVDQDIKEIMDDNSSLNIVEQTPSLDMLQSITKSIYRHRRLKTMRVASMILLPLIIVGACFWGFKAKEDRIVAQQLEIISVANGENVKVVMQDGTRISLRGGSQLQYNLNDSRWAKLEGEAYFEVTHNEKRPFRVEAGGMEVTVLGTVFNLKANQKDSMNILYLDQGSVAIRSIVGTDSYLLEPGNIAVFSRKDGKCSLSTADHPNEITGWMDRNFTYYNTPLKTLLEELHQAYGIDFEVKDTVCYKYRYTVTLRNNSIEEILSLLGEITPLHFVKTKNQIELYAKRR